MNCKNFSACIFDEWKAILLGREVADGRRDLPVILFFFPLGTTGRQRPPMNGRSRSCLTPAPLKGMVADRFARDLGRPTSPWTAARRSPRGLHPRGSRLAQAAPLAVSRGGGAAGAGFCSFYWCTVAGDAEGRRLRVCSTPGSGKGPALHPPAARLHGGNGKMITFIEQVFPAVRHLTA